MPRVKIVLEPLSARNRLRVRQQKSSAATCRRIRSPASRRSIRSCSASGVLAAFPVVDLKVTLIDGAYHEVDSSALAFEIASALGDARRTA